MFLYLYLLANVLAGAMVAFSGTPAEMPAPVIEEPVPVEAEPVHVVDDFVPAYNVPASIPDVPFYSQIRDISAPKWKKLSCGIADVAMIINFYKPGTVMPDELLWEGIAAGAFIDGVGWTHKGLADLAGAYGLKGEARDFSHLNKSGAFAAIAELLEDGPVIASVYYTFDPYSPIPHLVVINGVKDGKVYYNDPAMRNANNAISIDGFMRGWKKRIIVIRPQQYGNLLSFRHDIFY